MSSFKRLQYGLPLHYCLIRADGRIVMIRSSIVNRQLSIKEKNSQMDAMKRRFCPPKVFVNLTTMVG
jgi:hypothetical protein